MMGEITVDVKIVVMKVVAQGAKMGVSQALSICFYFE
jgi:hypothetical protein